MQNENECMIKGKSNNKWRDGAFQDKERRGKMRHSFAACSKWTTFLAISSWRVRVGLSSRNFSNSALSAGMSSKGFFLAQIFVLF